MEINIATHGPGGPILGWGDHWWHDSSLQTTSFNKQWYLWLPHITFSFLLRWLLSLYPGKRSKKHSQSFTKHAISYPVRSSLA